MALDINQKETKQLYNHVKASAKKRQIPFDISLSEFHNITIPISCPVLGIPLVFNNRFAKDNSVSFDRKDSSKGYTFDNIIVVSNRVNKLKSDATLDELIAISNYYTQIHKEEYESNYLNLFNSLISFHEIDHDWDGYNAKPPEKKMLNCSASLLRVFKENQITAPKIMISNDGEISFYWEVSSVYVELTIETDYTFSLFYESNTEMFDFEGQELPNEFSDLDEKLQETLKGL